MSFVLVLPEISKTMAINTLTWKILKKHLVNLGYIGLTNGQEWLNTASRMMQEEERLTIGGYGQVDCNLA